MLAVISPAKTLDYRSPLPAHRPTEPARLEESAELIAVLRRKTRKQLEAMMDISPALAEVNWERYRDWTLPFDPELARAALFAFKGDVYTGFSLAEYGTEDFRFAQKHLRILSGLYGVLRPLDRILPYRLEMGTTLKTPRGKNLYAFWGDRLTGDLDAALSQSSKAGQRTLINLASQEYFAAVKPDQLRGRVLTPHFREWKKGEYKLISFFTKKARGLMADFLIRNRLDDPESLKAFDSEGYRHHPELGDDVNWFFTRGESA